MQHRVNFANSPTEIFCKLPPRRHRGHTEIIILNPKRQGAALEIN